MFLSVLTNEDEDTFVYKVPKPDSMVSEYTPGIELVEDKFDHNEVGLVKEYEELIGAAIGSILNRFFYIESEEFQTRYEETRRLLIAES